MTVRSDSVGEQLRASGDSWCTHAPEEVVAAFDVDPAVGLSAARAAQLLSAHGPNSLPEERRTPAWRRFLRQYRSYLQIVLVAAAIVSLLIQQWTTAILLIVLTLLNAVVGLRQEGKAESAMNALQSMMKATARARHQGRRHRYRHGQRHGCGEERRTHDPLRRQVRHHRLRRGSRAGGSTTTSPSTSASYCSCWSPSC